MPINEILRFCPTDTGTNLLTESQYASATDRTVGNQPGVASSKLVNKAMRQSSYLVSGVAQMVSDTLAADVLDDGVPQKLLAQLNATFGFLPPVFTKYLSGAGTHLKTFIFFVDSANATVGATYSNSTFTFTVKSTITAGTYLQMTGNGEPSSNGVLTKVTGTGDVTISFYAKRSALTMLVEMVGGGGGGSGSATFGQPLPVGGAGGDTTLGASFLIAAGASAGGGGGVPSITGLTTYFALNGGAGSAGGNSNNSAAIVSQGGSGGSNPFGGGCGTDGPVNSGAGGGGALSPGNGTGGIGGGAGSYIKALIANPLASYAYSVGVGGALGSAGSGGSPGYAGASGALIIQEIFQ